MKNTILIADDNPEFVEQLKQVFADSRQFEVCAVAYDGEEAEKLYAELKPDITLLDLVMPKKDGFGFLQSITKGSGKIIVLSALSKDIFVSKAMSLGADYYMRKPCSFKELKVRAKELLDGDRPKVSANRYSREMDERISNIFITVGIPAHIKGYHFFVVLLVLYMINLYILILPVIVFLLLRQINFVHHKNIYCLSVHT